MLVAPPFSGARRATSTPADQLEITQGPATSSAIAIRLVD
ncbi:Hypothetical protein A7982_02495 [Minicystis rosea]|nr:Hypothetical protein A7982_02495 [Minicystis rosea]